MEAACPCPVSFPALPTCPDVSLPLRPLSVPSPFPSCVSPTASNAWQCGSWRSITMTFPSTTLPFSTCPSPSWPRKCLASRCIPSERVSGPAPQPSWSLPQQDSKLPPPCSSRPLLPLLSPFLGPCPRRFCSVLCLDSRWLVLAADPTCCPFMPWCIPQSGSSASAHLPWS